MRALRLGAVLCALLSTAAAQRRVPILLDTDIGDAIDDALALGLALNSPELDVRAVTTVIDDVESKTRLAWKELGIFGRRDIPLAMGAPEPLLDPVLHTHPKQFEVLTAADTVPESARRSAVSLIIDTLDRSPGKLTLVAIGPLTNIALALKTDLRIKAKIDRIVLMGGAYQTREAEYNIQRDRAAAEIVFGSGVPITAVGLDVTRPCKLREEDLARLRAAGNPRSQFLLRLIALAQAETKEAYPTLYDPLAVAVTFRPELIRTQAGQVRITPEGITELRKPGEYQNVQVGVNVNVQAFLDLFISRVVR
jgi:inosine-uridine nucleoside N-ribohydrolase